MTLTPHPGRLAEHSASLRAEPPLRLPPGRTESEAIAVARKWREIIWNGAAGKGLDENGKIDLLVKTCQQMCSGHLPSGKRLATMAIWTP